MQRNLPLSLTGRADRVIAHYEHGGEWSCINVSGDQRFIVGASGLKLNPSERRGPRSGENSEEVRTSEWHRPQSGGIQSEWRTTPGRLDVAEASG